MMSTGQPATALVIALTILMGGCELEQRTTLTAPSDLAARFLGVWRSSSASTTFPTPDSCSAFDWRVTSEDGNTITGDFSATCTGGVQLAGTATGTVLGTTLNWNAAGTATLPIAPACPFSLTGTGVLEGDDTIRVDYSGTTCLGPISGTEIVKKE